MRKSMKFQPLKVLHQAGFEGVTIGVGSTNITWNLPIEGQEAAWELYIELITRTTTTYLDDDLGNDVTALESVVSIFGTTREVLRRRGVRSQNLGKIIIPILNQVIRPFTTKWHGKVCEDKINLLFRDELHHLRKQLIGFNAILAHLAGVEDISKMPLPEVQPCPGNKSTSL